MQVQPRVAWAKAARGRGERRSRVRQRVEGDLIDRRGAMDARRMDDPSMDARATASTPLMNRAWRWGARRLGLVSGCLVGPNGPGEEEFGFCFVLFYLYFSLLFSFISLILYSFMKSKTHT